MEKLTIGKLARKAGVNIQTIRFYEREALLLPAARNGSGYRVFPAEAARRVRFIKRAKELGFSLKEIKELLSLRLDPETTCEDIRLRAEEKIGDVEARIRTLEKIKQALAELTAACRKRNRGGEPLRECPILESLEAEEGA